MFRGRKKYRWLAAAVVVVLVGRWVWLGLEGFPFPATSPGRYAVIARRFHDETLDGPAHARLLAGFPDDVPAAATDVRFYYVTPPGDVDLELRCVLPPADLAAVIARAAATAKVVAHGTDDLSGQRFDGDVPPTFHLGDGPTDGRLPPSFTIYVAGLGHARADNDRTVWTYESGVAVDPARRIALWWMVGAASGATPAPASRP